MCSFGLRSAFPPLFRCCHCCHFVSGRWPETCRFPAVLSCFPAVLRLEPPTFNPSVLGSNPRGPTTNPYIRDGSCCGSIASPRAERSGLGVAVLRSSRIRECPMADSASFRPVPRVRGTSSKGLFCRRHSFRMTMTLMKAGAPWAPKRRGAWVVYRRCTPKFTPVLGRKVAFLRPFPASSLLVRYSR